MRVKILIILVIIYILSAFVWLTFSLLNYTNTDFELKQSVLKAGLNACILQVVQNAKNNNLGNDDSIQYFLKQLELNVDSAELRKFVNKQFDYNYDIKFNPLTPSKMVVQIGINPDKLQTLMIERNQQRNIWLYQSLLLLVLVAAGIYGVYYSIDSIYQLNKRQNNFLLSVTHEFKTPIAAIRLMLQTSKNPKVKEDKRAELIENSIQNTFRLEELAENMLTAMQIENKKYQFNLNQVNFSEIVEQSVNNQQINGDIKAEIEDDIYLTGDGFILRMVVNNLIVNAFKYSDNKPIVVKLFRKGNKKVLQVIDQGIGIKKQEYKNIFKKFYRVQDEETRTTKGTGLGLFIVKQTLKRHKGKIAVSANKPKGSVFTIEFN